ncbi:hypothetical protein T05_11743 [Trichinella murrelli]|uniref:Uncharacterized protein n=1 Tax=Trichinella murrelli TaxID=144512 RepID=A0A0V0UGG1_9BILA|nr:hypothetical protein T05_11743 [Trichinella murrelli]
MTATKNRPTRPAANKMNNAENDIAGTNNNRADLAHVDQYHHVHSGEHASNDRWPDAQLFPTT